MKLLVLITTRIKRIIDEDEDIAVGIDKYLRRMAEYKGGISNYTYEVFGYGDRKVNVQIQMAHGEPFIEVPLEINAPETNFDNAMKIVQANNQC